ncbi:30S ribosomal protein S6 [Thermospira aquatica]|uniref:Small ribosomal subunit protein bS6 n=1 Tax=Thermospira aquatica TaxID=2828656 RepID=A0AAX3BF44_9SPIR|nr:30S ribosomal protein S6 [Thermospira aquatica]URA10765.1 30S ribosomal protein S6 [Thermospira aquatica]
MKRTYEMAFLLKEGEASVQAQSRIKDYVKRFNGVVVTESNMGLRDLAYVIHKKRQKFLRAFYYFLDVEMETSQVDAFEKLVHYDEDVIRHMVLVK